MIRAGVEQRFHGRLHGIDVGGCASRRLRRLRAAGLAARRPLLSVTPDMGMTNPDPDAVVTLSKARQPEMRDRGVAYLRVVQTFGAVLFSNSPSILIYGLLPRC